MSMPITSIFQLLTKNAFVRSGIAASNFSPRSTCLLKHGDFYSTASTASAVESQEQKLPENPGGVKKMSKAMLSYLERAKAHDAFIQTERQNFQIGKRHLANMMGEDPEHFSQKDINQAISYLLPSGLFDKAARPIMCPPEDIFPPRKAAEFDESGRPFHSMFYTASPAYYKTLYDIVEQIQGLNTFEDDRIRQNMLPDPDNVLDLNSSDWISHKHFEKKLLETVKDREAHEPSQFVLDDRIEVRNNLIKCFEYEYFISTMERLVVHPYAYKARQFIMEYRVSKRSLVQTVTVPELRYDSDERPFVTVQDCMRKKARGTVTLRGNGSGIITINGQSLIHYFPNVTNREQIILNDLHPNAKSLTRVDVYPFLIEGGSRSLENYGDLNGYR